VGHTAAGGYEYRDLVLQVRGGQAIKYSHESSGTNKRSTYTKNRALTLLEEDAPSLNMYMSRRQLKSLS
jgi:hypothetical protein